MPGRFLALALAALLAALAPPTSFAHSSAEHACQEAPNVRHPHGCDGVTTELFLRIPAEAPLLRSCMTTEAPAATETSRSFLLYRLRASQVVNTDADGIEFQHACSPFLVSTGRDGWDIHPGQAPAEPIDFRGANPVLTVYVAPADWPQDGVEANVLPNLGVYAALVEDIRMADARIAAEGDTGSGFGSPGAGSGGVTIVRLPGQAPVYEVRVPLEVRTSELRAAPDNGFLSLYVVPYQVEDEEVAFTQSGWRLVSSPEYPSRLTVFHSTGMVSPEARVHANQTHLDVLWRFNSVWGSWDVDDASVDVRVTGPVSRDMNELVRDGLRVVIPTWHGGQDEPWRIEWLHDNHAPAEDALGIRPTRLPAGVYTLHAYAANHQGSDALEWERTFEVPEASRMEPAKLEGDVSVPSAGLWIALAAFGAALAGRRHAGR